MCSTTNQSEKTWQERAEQMGSGKNRDQNEHDENQAEQSMNIGRVTSRQDEQTKNEQSEMQEKGTRRPDYSRRKGRQA